jgi:hypothetical protein
MKILNNLKEKIAENSEYIDLKITAYFADRLGVGDVKTINALGTDGEFTFNQKVNLFCELLPLSHIDKAKFKVYLRIHNETFENTELSHSDPYFSKLNNYHPFLFNNYVEYKEFLSTEEKLTFAINQLIDDVALLTPYYIKKPKIYYNKNVGITLPLI